MFTEKKAHHIEKRLISYWSQPKGLYQKIKRVSDDWILRHFGLINFSASKFKCIVSAIKLLGVVKNH